MIREEKQLLRARMKTTLREMPARAAHSEALRSALLATEAWRAARVIYGFIPMSSEPDWQADLWPPEKILAFPRTEENGLMRFFCSREFRIGPWKAHEPVGDAAAPAPDLILVPGLAFDSTGHRMGRGGGFYDRWLVGQLGVKKIGVCFSCQIVERVPREEHDIRLDALVTEEGFLPARTS